MSTELRPRLSRATIAHQVRDDLREQIKSGALSAGTKVPSEAECCDIYGVSRATVREAYRLLEQEGLIETRHGSGRYVLHGANVIVQGEVKLMESALDVLRGLNYEPKLEVLRTEERAATAGEASEFGIPVGSRMVEVERAYVHGRQLLVHTTNLIDVDRLPKPIERMDWTSSLATAYRAVGREITSGFSDIAATHLPSDVAQKFEIPDASAWLTFDGPLFDQHGEFLWFSHECWWNDLRPLRVVTRPATD